jgi:hypothetical protein
MFDSPGDDSEALAALALIEAGFDKLLAMDASALNGAQQCDVLRRFEVQMRRRPTVDHFLIATAEASNLAASQCNTSTAAMLRGMLLIGRREAFARVRSAADLGPRRGLSGQALPALFPAVAAAQARGLLSPAHAKVIVSAVEKLPYAVQVECGDSVQASLVAQAAVLDPDQLVLVARRIHDHLDPDGTLTDEADQQHNRNFAMNTKRDGSWDLGGRLTPECGEAWSVILEALATPAPSADGVKDERHAGQRMHDALLECAKRLLRSDLPSTAGLPVSILVTMTAAQFTTGQGYAQTGHGQLIPAKTALDLLASQGGTVQTALLDAHGAILDYGREKRLPTAEMRRALITRDRGCTFPGCDRSAAWCEAHHLLEWLLGGRTAIDNLTLVCGYHHRNFEAAGWETIMLKARPHWIPPAWIDPDQVPRLNTMHHIDIRDPN